MGRGKSKSVYNTPYSEKENHAVDNRVYMTKQHELTVGMREEKKKMTGQRKRQMPITSTAQNFTQNISETRQII